MRQIKFRDLLYSVAFKMGEDPGRDDFLTNQAIAVASYINSWVRRLWMATDWPEWTFIRECAVGSDHIVSYDQFVADGTQPGNPSILRIGRVLKVYLIDPRISDGSFDTSFRLMDNGIHVGFEHGTSVFVKFVGYPSTYTADTWLNSVSYAKDDVVYAPVKGEVFKSKINNNLGNNPDNAFFPLPLSVELLQTSQRDDPGLAATDKILDVYLQPALSSGGATTGPSLPPAYQIPNPPPNGSQFYIPVTNSAGALIAHANHTANGTDTLQIILQDLYNQLHTDPALTTFTVTQDAANLKIRLDAPQEFYVDSFDGLSHATYLPLGGQTYVLKVIPIQAFVAASSSAFGTNQILKTTLTSDQVISLATYSLTFRGPNGDTHTVEYMAGDFESQNQILSGLLDAMHASTDAFFQTVSGSLDTAGNSLSFSTALPVSLDTQIRIIGDPFWEVVPFPAALAEQIIRGARADTLGEMAQEDKKQAEEQIVPTEQSARAGTFTSPSFNPLTDQRMPRSRYKITQ